MSEYERGAYAAPCLHAPQFTPCDGKMFKIRQASFLLACSNTQPVQMQAAVLPDGAVAERLAKPLAAAPAPSPLRALRTQRAVLNEGAAPAPAPSPLTMIKLRLAQLAHAAPAARDQRPDAASMGGR
jgi:hypothetical protein